MTWRERAACRASDAMLFDNRLDRTTHNRELEYDRGVRHGQAIEQCARCPVAQQCLDDALADPNREGVHGGYPIENEEIHGD